MTRLRTTMLAVLGTVLSGCIGATDVFAPQRHAARPDAQGLDIRGEDELGPLRHERLDLGGQRIALSSLGAPGEGPLIVSCFGNASDRRVNGIDYLRKLQPHGEAVVWDYPGYADSTGVAEVEVFDAVIADLMPVLAERAGDRPLVLWGHSLGGFVCAQMTARSDAVDALVLETTAPNVRQVAREWLPVGMGRLIPIAGALKRYDTPAALADFDGPVLILGAGRDRVLPVSLSRQLAEALPRARYLELPEATHYSAGFDPRAQAAVAAMLDGL